MPEERPLPGFDIEDLLVHREWVGRVARTLVHGDAEAGDLEQRAWLRVLEHPPAEAPRSPRGWLRSVLRFAAIDGTRAERTRRRHEEAAAAREREDTTPDALVARTEALDRLVHAVLELEEPYRTTVLLRYFEDLPPGEIARRQGVPVETVRTRIKRAVEILRRRLGGDRGREGLMLALAPLLRPEGKSVAAGAAGGVAMGIGAKLAFAVAAAVAVAAALVAGGVLGGRDPGTEAGTPPRATPGAHAPPSPATTVPPAPAAAFPPAPPAPPSPPPPAPPAEKEAPAPVLEARLARVVPVAWDGLTVGAVVLDLAHQVDREPEYESRELEVRCFSQSLSARLERGLPVREALSLALRSVPSPVEGKVTSWEVRNDRIFVLLAAPPAPPKESAEAEKARTTKEEALLARIRSEKTAFVFDGQTLPEAFSYLSARHGINLLVDDSIKERADHVKVKLALKEVTLAEALDELLRLDPDLVWEVRGNSVLVRGK